MKILEVSTYKDAIKEHWRIFFIGTVTFKHNSHRLFESNVPKKYYTNELIRAVKP